MKVLVAEDDPVSRRALEITLKRWGYEVVAVEDGARAWEVLQAADAPRLAVLDWMMPGLDGVQVCQQVRARDSSEPPYLIMLSAKSGKEDVVAGLEGGADDYLSKPVDLHELQARLKVATRIVDLQHKLSERVRELGEALQGIKRLQGLLPICAYCKKVRNDQNYWQQVEAYVSEHSGVQFSHSICPQCFEEQVRPQLEQLPNFPSV